MSAKGTIASLTLYVNRGITPKYTEDKERAIPVLNQKCIRGHKVNLEPARLNDLSKRKVTAEKILEKYDVLINSTGVGTLGRVAQFYGETGSATVDSHVTIVRPNPELIDPIYFGYLVKFKQSLIEGFAEGTTGQTELARDSVKELVVEYIDDYKTQKQVGLALLAIDKKIEINRQTNQTLEHIAQAIFKSWFVDFEPTRAKISAKQAGQDPERAAMAAISGLSITDAAGAPLDELDQLSPEQQEQLKATAALFPDALVDSALGEIPEGWEVSQLGEIIEFNPRRTLKKGELAPYLDMKNVPTKGHLAEDVYLREMGSGTKFINGDTLLARITPCLENGKTAYVDFLDEGQVAWGSTEYIIMRPKDGRSLSLAYLIARLDSFRTQAIQTMTGTSGRQRANAKALSEQVWLNYPLELLEVFDTYSSNYLKQARSNGNENKYLAQLRASLLPQLLSGELSAQSRRDI